MAQLRAGAAELDITPWLGIAIAGYFIPRKAEDIHDPLRAKALVLDDGRTRLAMVVLDLLGLGRADVQAIRAQVAEATDIAADCVMVTCTHTHTGPAVRQPGEPEREDAYVQWMIRRAADAVRIAELRLQPARLATGRGELHGVCFCRRWRMRDGSVRMNPEPGDPDIVEPTSPVDPTVGLLYVEDSAGQPLAVLAQYGLHFVGTDNGRHISADYFGHFADAIRRILGPACQPMLMNGTSGQVNNLNPLNPNRLRGHQQGKRVAAALAAEVVRIIATITPTAEATLASATEHIALPRKRVTADDVELAEKIIAQSETNPMEGRFSYVVGQPIPANLVVERYAKGCRKLYELDGQPIEAEVQAFRIGDSGWVALPGEIFVEIGLAIKDQSPLSQTFVIGLANDYLGYIPTDHALQHEGGYETWATPRNAVGVGAETILCRAADRVLAQVTAPTSATA
ncbi:neutral/alkaline non-lysosomal ceramidase N-terminal domain-containing protein [Phycisphaerales bacterium AB-hyl4]|uniref:Neutral/alkaline non-lysosomal ceramidase N-terminal domain-containing protein n=1 Tax=Natronomicrosphaera hydrolytica TaxID=3242702 RepID=A0ABV4U2F5_9BACT